QVGAYADDKMRNIGIFYADQQLVWHTLALSDPLPNEAGATERLTVTFTLPYDAYALWIAFYNGSDSDQDSIYIDSVTIEDGQSDGSWFTDVSADEFEHDELLTSRSDNDDATTSGFEYALDDGHAYALQ